MRTGYWIACCFIWHIALAQKFLEDAPGVFEIGDLIPVSVNKLFSEDDPTVYDFYSIPYFPQPVRGPRKAGHSLSQFFLGDVYMDSSFQIRMLHDTECKTLDTLEVGPEILKELRSLIVRGYKVDWLVDGLPAASSLLSIDKRQKYYLRGFPLGEVNHKGVFLNNHFTFVFRYKTAQNREDAGNIVGFEVYPKSMDGPPYQCPRNVASIDANGPTLKIADDAVRADSMKDLSYVPFTYSVYFIEEPEVSLDRRMQLFYFNISTDINTPQVVAGLVICLCLLMLELIVGVHTFRTSSLFGRSLKEEPNNFRDSSLASDLGRSPVYGGLLSVLVGSGTQLVFCALTLLPLAKAEIESYWKLHTIVAALFALASLLGGFASTKLYKGMNGTDWRYNAYITALVSPLVLFFCSSNANSYVSVERASIISASMVYLAGYLCFKSTKDDPQSANKNGISKKPIPPQPAFLKMSACIFLAGLIPTFITAVLGKVISMSLFVLVDNGYKKLYTLSMVVVLVYDSIAIIITTPIFTFLQISYGNYRWWWRSFIIGASSCTYLTVLFFYFAFTSLRTQGFGSTIFFLCSACSAISICVLYTGTIGFLASFGLVKYICLFK